MLVGLGLLVLLLPIACCWYCAWCCARILGPQQGRRNTTTILCCVLARGGTSPPCRCQVFDSTYGPEGCRRPGCWWAREVGRRGREVACRRAGRTNQQPRRSRWRSMPRGAAVLANTRDHLYVALTVANNNTTLATSQKKPEKQNKT